MFNELILGTILANSWGLGSKIPILKLARITWRLLEGE